MSIKAIVTTGQGGYERLVYKDVPMPQLQTGEVLLRVLAAGINNTDINTRVGWYDASVTTETKDAESAPGGQGAIAGAARGWNGATPFPLIQGADCCGLVVAVAPGEDAKLIGERVLVRSCMRRHGFDSPETYWLGSDFDGAFAQFVKVPASEIFAVHCDWSDVELATIPCAYGTAENMLHRARVGAGDHVLVPGVNATGDWTAVGESVSIGQDYIPQYNQQNTVTFGAGWCAVSGSKTDIDVVFAQYSFPVGATYGAVGLGWSYAGFNAAKWRVRKVSSGAQIGGAIVSSNIVGRVDGNAPAAGYIGESLTNKVAAFTGSGGRVQIATLTLTPGVWLMSAVFTNSIINVAVGGTSLGICISTTSGNSTAGCVDGYDLVEGGFNAASGYGGVCIPSKVVVVPPGASVPYYLNGRTDHTTANDMVCSLSAVRIA